MIPTSTATSFSSRGAGSRSTRSCAPSCRCRGDCVWDRSTLTGSWVSYAEPNGGERLDNTPLSEWLAGAGAEPWLARLLDVAYTTEYGLEIAEQSALNFLLLIDPNPLPFRIFGESDERFHVRGGNDLIPRTLAERLGDRGRDGQACSRRSPPPGRPYVCSLGAAAA